jgi:LacI family transcriptional regulator
LAVVGADNTQLLCDFGPVPLTSVDTAGFQVGWRAAEVIHRWLETGDAPTGDTLVPPAGVVERQSTDVVPGSDPLIADAIRYIRAYARHGVTVEEVAARFAMSRRTLERHVRDVLGSSPHEEIRRVRFQLAKRLLLDEELILAEVSRRSGFGNAKHFAREFKAAFGLTPGEYRRRSGGK